MPVPDPRAGQAFICLITLFLFLSIAVGGGCLIAYTVLPYPPVWLSYLGIFFVCLPWFFWFLTFAYRIVSRTFGFRMVVGSGGNNNNASGDSMPRDVDPPDQSLESPDDDPETIPNPQGQVLVSIEGNQSKKRMSTSSNSTVGSHESEMPLAISMGSWSYTFWHMKGFCHRWHQAGDANQILSLLKTWDFLLFLFCILYRYRFVDPTKKKKFTPFTTTKVFFLKPKPQKVDMVFQLRMFDTKGYSWRCFWRGSCVTRIL